MLKKGVIFVWTLEPNQIVQALLERLLNPDVLALPEFDAAITSGRLFHLVTDPSVDGLSAVVSKTTKTVMCVRFVF